MLDATRMRQSRGEGALLEELIGATIRSPPLPPCSTSNPCRVVEVEVRLVSGLVTFKSVPKCTRHSELA